MTKWRFLISCLALLTPALAAAQDAKDPHPPSAAGAQSAWQAVPAAPDETRSPNATMVPGAGGRLHLAFNAPLVRYLARTTSPGDAPELDASGVEVCGRFAHMWNHSHDEGCGSAYARSKRA